MLKDNWKTQYKRQKEIVKYCISQQKIKRNVLKDQLKEQEKILKEDWTDLEKMPLKNVKKCIKKEKLKENVLKKPIKNTKEF